MSEADIENQIFKIKARQLKFLGVIPFFGILRFLTNREMHYLLYGYS